MITKALITLVGVLALSLFGTGYALKAQKAVAAAAALREATAIESLADQRATSASLKAQLERSQEAARLAIERERTDLAKREASTTTARVENEKIQTKIAQAVSVSECADVSVPPAAVDGLRAAANYANGVRDGRG